MHAGIVKFDPLTDPYRARAKHQHLLFIRHHRLIFLFIGGIEIGHIALKLGGAGVYHLIDRDYAVFDALLSYLLLLKLPKKGYRPVRIPKDLAFIKEPRIAPVRFKLCFHPDDPVYLSQK